ncbi:hypothetical protein CY0110_17762 [Crocosphaera chwakensis CCY0110]|uniref:Uncharacterized protein n=1 Tax=Crocosphaera chwakensis CCY0110 TaxID=391612 RepID=A3IIN4_9CHRO|nr:hypothetical protein CY0110_17762 [Crocosphaera chwakensis CCY0110]
MFKLMPLFSAIDSADITTVSNIS